MRFLFQLCLVLLMLWLAGFVYYYMQIYPPPSDSGEPCEALVVLTGSAGRVEAGLKLLEDARAPRLFITGVGDDRHSEAFLNTFKPSPQLRDKLREQGVFTIDRAATSTFENAYETKRWLDKTGFSTLCLVTAHYHLPRSLAVFRTTMPKKRWIPISTSGWDVRPEEMFENKTQALVLIREYHKWLFVSLTYWAIS
jgi:uncharacterized SAM-binding protein YcdF (DUF218 family)